MKDYVFSDIEKKWIDFWADKDIYSFQDSPFAEKRKYILDMFPFPSGAGLHVGHLKGYLATDILTRYYTMNGYLVFHPMGWDSFGLPAEQYAISTGKDPAAFTKQNIDSFRNQLKRLMLSYDFSWEVNTSDPEYYKTTQKIFSEMYKRGLAETKKTTVNWCHELNTVLSDEEIVIKNGKCYSERGNFPVEKKVMDQWLLKITDYAEKLLSGLEGLNWPKNIKKMQRDWIGKQNKYVYELKFKDKIYFLYLKYASSLRRLKGVGIHIFSLLYKELNMDIKNLGDGELLDIKLRNMSNHEDISVFFLRDVDFRSEDLIPIFDQEEEDFYDEEVEEYYVRKFRLKEIVKYKMKDWVFSRQRYWGEPIPILYDEKGNMYLDENLPLKLPDSVDYTLNREAKSPLVNNSEWLNVMRDGKKYVRETNTMPNWAGSSWYFLAFLLKSIDGTYIDLFSEKAKEILDRWIPVDIYVGGAEHATLHLLYARFWHKFLYDIGVVSSPEPFKSLFNQGMVLGEDGQKMSKSKGNYVSVDEILEKYGADALRVYEAFSGPVQLSFNWDDRGLKSSQQWLNRVWIFFNSLESFKEVDSYDEDISKSENRMIKNVSSAVPALKINLGVSEMMIFLNDLNSFKKYSKKSLESFVKILSLYAPALAEELWVEYLYNEDPLFRSKWPELNKEDQNSPKEYQVFYDGKYKFSMRLTLSELEKIDEIKQEIEKKLNLVDPNITIISNRKVILVRLSS